MMDRMSKIEPLTDCESIVMKCLWDAQKDISLMDIMASLEEKYNKDWKRQTVSTFLLHLINKKYVSSYRVGRIFYYKIELPKEDYLRKTTRDFLDFWYDGSLELLEKTVESWKGNAEE